MESSPSYELYLEIGHSIGATESQMFGKPCFKLNSKAFLCFSQDEIVFKLEGDAHATAIGLTGAKLFNPSGKGRPMKDATMKKSEKGDVIWAWVQVPYEHQEEWKGLAEKAASPFFNQ